jgi:hypothetical protein
MIFSLILRCRHKEGRNGQTDSHAIRIKPFSYLRQQGGKGELPLSFCLSVSVSIVKHKSRSFPTQRLEFRSSLLQISTISQVKQLVSQSS